MRNKLIDLNDHLFTQIERLCDEGLSEDELARECKRTDAIVAVSEQIVANASLSLKAAELIAEYGGKFEKALPMIESRDTVMEERRNGGSKWR